jgi:hypothetical protein
MSRIWTDQNKRNWDYDNINRLGFRNSYQGVDGLSRWEVMEVCITGTFWCLGSALHTALVWRGDEGGCAQQNSHRWSGCRCSNSSLPWWSRCSGPWSPCCYPKRQLGRGQEWAQRHGLRGSPKGTEGPKGRLGGCPPRAWCEQGGGAWQHPPEGREYRRWHPGWGCDSGGGLTLYRQHHLDPACRAAPAPLMPTRDVDLGQQGKEEERMRSVRASTCRARHRIHGGDGGSSSSVGERGEQGKREADNGRSGGERSTSFFFHANLTRTRKGRGSRAEAQYGGTLRWRAEKERWWLDWMDAEGGQHCRTVDGRYCC